MSVSKNQLKAVYPKLYGNCEQLPVICFGNTYQRKSKKGKVHLVKKKKMSHKKKTVLALSGAVAATLIPLVIMSRQSNKFRQNINKSVKHMEDKQAEFEMWEKLRNAVENPATKATSPVKRVMRKIFQVP